MLKLYKCLRHYGSATILEFCWAENDIEVFRLLEWEKRDKPQLEIEEIEPKKGCFISVSIK